MTIVLRLKGFSHFANVSKGALFNTTSPCESRYLNYDKVRRCVVHGANIGWNAMECPDREADLTHTSSRKEGGLAFGQR